MRLPIDPQTPCGHLWTLILTEVSQGLSHFRNNRGRDFAFVMNITGVTPYRLILSQMLYLELYVIPSETCTSCGSIVFWTTECHTAPARPDVTGLERFTRLRIFTKKDPLPINCHTALGDKVLLARYDHPSSLAVDVCMEILRAATSACRLSICHPRQKHLPSSNIVPQFVNLRNSQDWVCLVVPYSEEYGRRARVLLLSLPFNKDI